MLILAEEDDSGGRIHCDTHRHTQTQKHTNTHTHTFVHTHAPLSLSLSLSLCHTHTHTHTNTHTHTRTHIHTNIYLHTAFGKQEHHTLSVLPHVRTCCVCEKKILHHHAHAHTQTRACARARTHTRACAPHTDPLQFSGNKMRRERPHAHKSISVLFKLDKHGCTP
jgi:hypothetical protein